MDARKQSFPKTLMPDPMRMPRQDSREAWLLGQPALQDYIDHVRKNVVGGGEIAKSALIDEWRVANDHYYDLETSEAGLPDTVGIRDLGADLQPLAEALKASVPFKNSFDDVPSRVAFVELDKLIVAQPNIDLDHIDRLIANIGATPDPETLFKPSPAVKMRRAGSKRFLFWSDCHDFRFHEATVLSPTQITDYESFGPLAAILGLGVGFGSNFLAAIESDKRLLLHNGHHRAYALRRLGITHAPCILQTVTRLDELNIIAPSNVIRSPGYYFKAKRPPLLKDFFDPKLGKALNVSKTVRVVEISFETKEFDIKDFNDVDPSHSS
jgi:hypothetical protein